MEKLTSDLEVVKNIAVMPTKIYSEQKEKVRVMEDLINLYGDYDKVFRTNCDKEILALHESRV